MNARYTKTLIFNSMKVYSTIERFSPIEQLLNYYKTNFLN